MRKQPVLFLIIAALLLSACAAAPSKSSGEMPAGAPSPGYVTSEESGMIDGDFYGRNNDMATAPEMEMPPAEPASPGMGQSAQEVRRLVIRNANLTILVESPPDAQSAIARMAEGMGGYVVSSNLYKRTNAAGREFPEANLTVRVPAERLTEALNQIKGLVGDPTVDVLNENISGQDVTKEYTDLQSRLRNLEETEQQLREILGSATRTDDVLAVHYRLTEIREQIEMIKGQIKYYEESAALSAITVNIQAKAAVQPIEIAGWQPVGVARDAVQALVDTVQSLGSIAIWLALYVLPVLLLVFIPLRLLWLLYRRMRPAARRPVETPPPASPEA